MKKALAWLGIFALLLNPSFGLVKTATAGPVGSYNYTLEGLNYNKDPLVDGNWTTGNLCQGGGGCYSEGSNVPSRITITGLTSGDSYSLIIQHDYKDSSGLIGYDNFNRIGTVRTDSNASGVTIVHLSDVTQSGDIMRNYTLSFQASGSTAVIYWNSFLGVNAADWNGASLHFRLDSGIGGENVGNKEVPIMVNQLLYLPSITLTKTVDHGSAAPDLWDFNVSPSINGQSTYNIPDGQSSITIDNVPDGTYSITEAAGAAGYQFNSGNGTNCTFNGSTASAIVSAGDPANSATCNFHNTQSIGSILVHKDVQGPNGENITDTSTNFDIYLDGGNKISLTDGGTYTYDNVMTGSHTISEPNLPAGYTLYSITPDGNISTPGAQITVSYNSLTEVFITNRQIAATVNVYKNVLSPSGADISDNHSFSTQLNSVTKSISESAGATYTLNPGIYTLQELADLNYDFVGFSYDEDVNASGSQITLSPGETQNVTITNKQKSARIIVHKDVIGPSGSDVSDNHSFTAQRNSGDDKTISESTTATYWVDPFTAQTISEVADAAYQELGCFMPTGAAATAFQLGSNETINVTCLNQQIQSIVRIHKNVFLADGTDVSDNTVFTVRVDNGNPQSLSESNFVTYLLPPGTYTFSEDFLQGYFIHQINPDNNGNPTDGTRLTLSSGQIIDVYFDNYREIGEIEITKQVEPSDESSWDFTVSGPATYFANNLSDNGSWSEDQALTGTYSITESSDTDNVNNYSTTYVCREGKKVIAEGSGKMVTGLELDAEESISCEFTNTINRGSVTVEKYNDENADGEFDQDESTMSGWQFDLSGTTQTTGDDGQTTFDNLLSGDYTLSEIGQEGWEIINIDCQYQNEEIPFLSGTESVGSTSISLDPGDNVFCQVGNHFPQPSLEIEKSNNRMSVPSQIGDIVTYTLVTTAHDNIVDNVKVSDTLPKDFNFIAGSSDVSSSDRGDITPLVTEPSYAGNVATWELGKMQKDEVITINYDALIGGNSTPGIYKDNAFVSGETLLGDPIFGTAGPIGFIDTSFVGTSVQIAAMQDIPNLYNVILGDQVITLASTPLPSTGSPTWIIFGLAFVATTLLSARKKIRNKLQFLAGGLFVFALVALLPSTTFAASHLNLQVETKTAPVTISTPDFDYSLLDIESRPNITVTCSKKGPSDAVFILFQTDTFDSRKVGTCDLASSPLTENGNYEIKVEASVLADNTATTVAFEYVAPGPGVPTNYSKTVNSCNSTISFNTANDGGKTTGIEIFRSENKIFSTSGLNLVESFSATSNQAINKTYLSPDCTKTYYYALRAFDAAHNTSGLIGDTGYNITYVQGTPAASSTSTGANLRTAAGSTATTSAGTATGTTTPPSAPSENTNGAVTGTTDNNGNVLGAQSENTETKKNNRYLYYVGGVIALAILYELIRKYFFSPVDRTPAPVVTVTKKTNGKKRKY